VRTRNSYHGPFTVEAAPRVLALLQELIGDPATPYVFTCYNEGFSPESGIGLEGRVERVAPESALNGEAISLTIHERENGGPPWAHIIVCDTYGVWSFSGEDAYVSISLHDGLYVRQRVGAGHLVHWKVKPLHRYSRALDRMLEGGER
jgi:hypothetical protein